MPIGNNQPEIDVNAVIFATDFFPCSENAGQYARHLASHFSAKLFVAHSFVMSQAAEEVEAESAKASQQRKNLNALLAGTADALSVSLKATPVLLDGDPHETVPRLAEEHAPSLLVLGTCGGGRIERVLVGSVAEAILRSTRWPCLTVGPRTPPASDKTIPFRRILFATDFTPAATHASVYAISLAEASGGTIDVLNVVPQYAMEDSQRRAELASEYFNALDRLIPEKAGEFCNPRTFVEAGSAHDRILGHIREQAIDLLVLGIHKSSHLGLKMRTSGAFRLIAEAPCPVLTVTS